MSRALVSACWKTSLDLAQRRCSKAPALARGPVKDRSFARERHDGDARRAGQRELLHERHRRLPGRRGERDASQQAGEQDLGLKHRKVAADAAAGGGVRARWVGVAGRWV
jgi:hypothetical protein